MKESTMLQRRAKACNKKFRMLMVKYERQMKRVIQLDNEARVTEREALAYQTQANNLIEEAYVKGWRPK